MLVSGMTCSSFGFPCGKHKIGHGMSWLSSGKLHEELLRKLALHLAAQPHPLDQPPVQLEIEPALERSSEQIGEATWDCLSESERDGYGVGWMWSWRMLAMGRAVIGRGSLYSKTAATLSLYISFMPFSSQSSPRTS